MRVDLLPENEASGGDTNLENLGTGDTILVNNGIYPASVQRNFKSLIAGTNITITDSGSDLTIDASGGGTPNSDLANLGAGNAILATTGVLPVTNTRNFKTLVAGTNITLTPTANDITIAAVAGTDTNIYNTSGSLTANRTMTMNGNNLNFSGSGGFNVRINGTINIGDSSTTNVTIGRTGFPTFLQSDQLTITNLPVYNANTFVTFNTVSKLVGYTTYTPADNAIFSVGMDAFTQAGPFSPSYQFPTGFALAFSTAFPTNHPGYNNAGLTLNLVTGVYSPSQTNEYEILVKITLKNGTEIPNFQLTLYNATTATTVSSCICNGGEINKYNTWSLVDRLTLNAVNNYAFYITLNNGAATTYTVSESVFSINVV